MKKKFWTSDRIVSFSAIFISVLTLFIFIRQTNIIDKQSHLSVMPYLSMDSSNNSENNTFTIALINYGIGPAIIEDTKFYYKGKTYEMQFVDFLKAHITEMDSVQTINITTLNIGQAIPAGDNVNIVTAGGNEKSYTAFLKVMHNLEESDFEYEIQYRSIYGDQWKITGSKGSPEEID